MKNTQNLVETEDIAKLGTGAGVALVGRVGGRGLVVLGQIILARLLGPADFGLFALGWTMLSIAGLLVTLGLDKGVIRFGARYHHKDPSSFRDVIIQSIAFSLFSGLIVALAFFAFAPFLADEIFHKPGLEGVIRGFAPALVFLSGLKVAAAATRITQRIKFSVISEDIIPPAIQIITFLILFYAGLRLSGAVISVDAGFALGLAIALVFLIRLFPMRMDGMEIWSSGTHELLTFSLMAGFAGIFFLLTIWTNRLIVGVFQPSFEVGVYQAASQISLLTPILLSAFNMIFIPIIANLYHEKKFEKLEEMFKISTKWGLYLSIPIFLTILMVPHEALSVIFGKPYAIGASALIVLVLGQFANVMTGAVAWVLIMTGHQKIFFKLGFSTFVIGVGLSLWLTPILGMLGAAIATSVGVVILSAASLFKVRSKSRLWPYDKRYFKGFISALASILILILVLELLQASDLVRLLVTSILSVLLFFGILLIIGLDVEDLEFVRFLKGRLSEFS